MPTTSGRSRTRSMALMAELSPTPASLRSASMTHISPRSSSVLTTRLPLHRISQNTIPTGGHMDVRQSHGYKPNRYTPTLTIQQQIWTVRSTFFIPANGKWRACLSCLVSFHVEKERPVQVSLLSSRILISMRICRVLSVRGSQ